MQLPQTLMHWLLVASAAGAIVFFCAGLTSFFEYSSKRPLWVLMIHHLGAVLSLAALAGVIVLPTRSDNWAVVGIALYSVAVSVFLSAMDAARPTRLQRATTSGGRGCSCRLSDSRPGPYNLRGGPSTRYAS